MSWIPTKTWKVSSTLTKQDEQFSRATGEEVFNFLELLPRGEISLDAIPKFVAYKKSGILHISKAADLSGEMSKEEEDLIISIISNEEIPESVKIRAWCTSGAKCYDVANNVQTYSAQVTSQGNFSSINQGLKYMYYALTSQKSVHISVRGNHRLLAITPLIPLVYVGIILEDFEMINPFNLLAYGVVKLCIQQDAGLPAVLEQHSFVKLHEVVTYLRDYRDSLCIEEGG